MRSAAVARRQREAQRRKFALGLGAAAFLLIGLPIAQPNLLWGAADAIADGIAPAKEFLTALSDRSPGKRSQAELTKIKRKLAAKNRAKPTQRALAKVVKPKEIPPALVEALTAAPPLVPPPVAPPVTVAEGPPPTTPGPPGYTPPGGPPIVTPPGGNPPPPTVREEPPPAVPEPGTWAMMLLGFGITGWALRRRPVVTRVSQPASA